MDVIISANRVEQMGYVVIQCLGLSLKNDGIPAKDNVNMQKCFPGVAII